MTSWLAHYGFLVVLLLMLIDAVFPAASELVMLYGGALASGALSHRVDVLGWQATGLGGYLAVVVAGVIGYQLGAVGGWWVGKRGERRSSSGTASGFASHRTRSRAARWFERWGSRAALLGRITPVARSFISIPAGVFNMPFRRYNLMTLRGNGLWCLVIAGAGWALGSNWDTFHKDFRFVEYAVVAGIVVVAAYVVLRLRRTATIAPADDDSPR